MPYSALLKGRVSIAGQHYLITTVCDQRRALFDSFESGRTAIHAMRAEERNGSAQTLACVVMPDHIHWLLRIGGGSLSDVVGRCKGRTSHELRRVRHVQGSVWQRGFHDHAVRSEESLESIARYVIENPVRAGLVADIREYSLWHSVWDL